MDIQKRQVVYIEVFPEAGIGIQAALPEGLREGREVAVHCAPPLGGGVGKRFLVRPVLPLQPFGDFFVGDREGLEGFLVAVEGKG